METVEYRLIVKGWKGTPDHTFVSFHHHPSPQGVAFERHRIGEDGLPNWQPHITDVLVEKRTVTPWESTADLDAEVSA